MTTVLEYKGYEAAVTVDVERMIVRGKLLFINDLVTFEASELRQLQKEFEEAVDDYIETCKELGRDPQKPIKGQFNVRVPVELHKELIRCAAKSNSKLNDVVVRACMAYVSPEQTVNHKVDVTVEMRPDSFQHAYAAASGATQWDVASAQLRVVENVH